MWYSYKETFSVSGGFAPAQTPLPLDLAGGTAPEALTPKYPAK